MREIGRNEIQPDMNERATVLVAFLLPFLELGQLARL